MSAGGGYQVAPGSLIARRRRRSSPGTTDMGEGLLAFVGLVALLGFMSFGIFYWVQDIGAIYSLREHGVHVTGVAVANWTEYLIDSEGDVHEVEHTKVDFTVGEERRVADVLGKYFVGTGVPVVYDPDDPGIVKSEAEIGTGGLVRSYALLVFCILGVISGIVAAFVFLVAE